MNILAVNPWIYDCAAYDFWLKPYGFLVILESLRTRGHKIDFIDCLDAKKTYDYYGRGKYISTVVEKPDVLKSIPRHFKRYGIPQEDFREKIKGKKPDIILLTSSMTYWYPGVRQAGKILKAEFPAIPVILGGTYATLCYDHAKRNIPCDIVFTNRNLARFFKYLGQKPPGDNFFNILPEYEHFYSSLAYVVIRTSWGCPFSCSYCAIKTLSSGFGRTPAETVIKYILRYQEKGIKDFVLYDDAFLYPPEYAKNILKQIKSLNLDIRFHTPNALHIRFIDEEMASLLKETGFINPHFGLEVLNEKLQKKWQKKADTSDALRGIAMLQKGGFKPGEISFYLLLGYPGQDLQELKKQVEQLHLLGARVSLAEFSPTPRTAIYNHYKNTLKDPLLHNNSIFGFFRKETIPDFWQIKNYARDLNKKWS